jgi:hypothetical protein
MHEDQVYSGGTQPHWKRIPLSEAHVLSAGRTGIIYHHNSRRSGGHTKEILHWIRLLGPKTIGCYWRRFSNRTFFIIHPDNGIQRLVREFSQRWAPHFELVSERHIDTPLESDSRHQAHIKSNTDTKQKACPECGHIFKGTGWVGMDAHWKANHQHIMLYEDVWPLIKLGNQPSREVAREEPAD